MRVRQLRQAQPQIDAKIVSACRGAALRAIEKAVELTPPAGGLSGAHTRTGSMKQHWASDSNANPVKKGKRYQTVLANNQEYASYVNDGHRMDRHFVPGLYINEESGLLEFDPERRGGILVGTKTKYVPGLYMAEAAEAEYIRVLQMELADIGGVLR